MNIIAFFQAYTFTHFSDAAGTKTDSKNLSWTQKVKAVFVGINNPRPVNRKLPQQVYQSITLQSNKQIECWLISADSSKGTVIIFHGYGGEKSSMLDKSDEFLRMGYNTMLVDFMGSGGSEGNQTTIGFKEAAEVKTCYEYLVNKNEKNIYLFGTSMGAAAILRAMHIYNLSPAGILLECPFGSMYKTTAARFTAMGIPKFPMAALLVFWGGVQNGFWAFSHNPATYARSVHCPSLLMYGERDNRVSGAETDAIFSAFQGKKTLVTFPLAGHENYLAHDSSTWRNAVDSFMKMADSK